MSRRGETDENDFHHALLAEICEWLASEETEHGEHYHVEPALYSAEPGSVPLEFLLTDKI